MDLEVFNLDEEELLKNIDEPDGLVLKNMNACYMSSDAHSPMSAMRTTQTNIGLQLAKEDTSADRYGVSKEQYGGVGPKYINEPRYMNAPRTMWHARTALHDEIPPIVSPHNRDLIVRNNKSLYASPISEVGTDVYNLWYSNHVDRRTREVQRSLFPRSIVYELEYIKNENHKVMLAALEKERQAFEEKKMRKRDQASQLKIDQEAMKVGKEKEVDACETAPPYWWKDPSGRPMKPGPEPNTGDFLYTTEPALTATEKCDVVREMQLDNPQGYIPGEIHKGAKVPVQIKTEGVANGCPIAEWSPRSAGFHRSFDPGQAQPSPVHQIGLNSKLDKSAAEGVILPKAGPRAVDDSAGPGCHGQPLGCQCHNELVHRHLGHVSTCTPLHPVVPHEKEEAAEVTTGGCMSVSSICGCESFKQGQRAKTDRPKVSEHDFPGTPIRYDPYGEEERQNELFKVGVPFKTQAAKWMNLNRDPLPPRPPPKQLSPWKE